MDGISLSTIWRIQIISRKFANYRPRIELVDERLTVYKSKETDKVALHVESAPPLPKVPSKMNPYEKAMKKIDEYQEREVCRQEG